jgi:hypothetical protein
MEHEQKNKLKKVGLWIAGVTLFILLAGNIVTVTYVVASNKLEINNFSKSVQSLETFKEESVKGQITQAQVNEKLITQLEILTKRVNRLDKAHKYTPLEWDDIQVPK